MLLVIDNYDSFVFNLARYLQQLGQSPLVVRNTAVDAAAVRRLRPDAVVLSPGPCAPAQAGCCLDVVRTLHREVPMLGVCLGHQVLAEALGGRVIRAPAPVHGQASAIRHDGRGVFAGLPNPFRGARYHSLAVDAASLPDCLEATAHSDDGALMAIRHRELPLVGLQFHPESILTEHGYALLAAFLRLAGIEPVERGV